MARIFHRAIATTIAGVHALERGGLRAAAMDAVLEAYLKTLKLMK